MMIKNLPSSSEKTKHIIAILTKEREEENHKMNSLSKTSSGNKLNTLS